MLGAVGCCVVRLQIRLQARHQAMTAYPSIPDFHDARSHVRLWHLADLRLADDHVR